MQNETFQSIVKSRRSKQGFGDEDILVLLCFLVEEMGEFSRCIRDQYIDKKPAVPENDKSSLKHEMADILIYLYTMADKFNIDLNEAVLSKLDINDKRFIK